MQDMSKIDLHDGDPDNTYCNFSIKGGGASGQNLNVKAVLGRKQWEQYFDSFQNEDSIPVMNEYKKIQFKAEIKKFIQKKDKGIRHVKEKGYNKIKSGFTAIFKRSVLQDLHEQEITLESNTKYYYHHLIPKIIGGPNEIWNVIPLTQEQHRLAHEWFDKTFKQ